MFVQYSPDRKEWVMTVVNEPNTTATSNNTKI